MLRVCSARRRHQDSASAWSSIPCVSLMLRHVLTWCKAAPLAGGPGARWRHRDGLSSRGFQLSHGHLAPGAYPRAPWFSGCSVAWSALGKGRAQACLGEFM